MNFKSFLALALGLAITCGMAKAHTVNLNVTGIPSPISESKQVSDGTYYYQSFNLPYGYCITNVAVTKGNLPVKGTCVGYFVGVDAFEGDCRSKDASNMMNLFKFTNGGCAKIVGAKYNDTATVSNITASIDKIIKNYKLGSGDTLVYYQSSKGLYESLCLYDDEEWSQSDFCDYFSSIAKKGLNVIVILDADFAASMSSDDDSYWLLAGSSAHELSYQIPALGMSAYTAALYNFGCCALADKDFNTIITAQELFEGAAGYMKAANFKKQNPDCGNVIPALAKLPLVSLNNEDAYGSLSYNDDSGKYEYAFTSVTRDYTVTLLACPMEANPLGLSVQKFSAAFKLTSEFPGPGDPMKVSATMSVNNIGWDFVPSEIVGPFMINGQQITCVPVNFAKLNSKQLKSVQYFVVDEYWNKIGKLNVKVNAKKYLTTYQFSIKCQDSMGFYSAFNPEDSVQLAFFSMRINKNYFEFTHSLDNKFKASKSFSSKLAKVQP